MGTERRREKSKVGLASFAASIVLAAAQLGATCVDGVTPDCSDPAVCAPNPGNVANADASSVVPEGGGDVVPDAGTPDAETELDADADGG
ncbi:MAG: hypothetical protein KF764_26570 [Labilithrix sp.]|nr:hypothetical protein [Labilithrix sp.]